MKVWVVVTDDFNWYGVVSVPKIMLPTRLLARNPMQNQSLMHTVVQRHTYNSVFAMQWIEWKHPHIFLVLLTTCTKFPFCQTMIVKTHNMINVVVDGEQMKIKTRDKIADSYTGQGVL